MSKADRAVWAGLSRNVLVLGLVSLLTDMAAEMIVPLLPYFLEDQLFAGPQILGVIAGASESLASFLKLLSGWLSDRIGKRKLLIVLGYGVASLVRPLMGLATSWWHVLVVRVIDRAGKGIRIAPRDALLADSCDEAVRGRAFGFQQMADNVGGATGPLIALALLLLVTRDMRTVFLLAAIPGALVLVAAAAGIGEKPPTKQAEPVRVSLAPFGAPFRLYLVATLLFHLAVASDFFIILRMKSAGFSITQALLGWSAFAAVRSVTAMYGGHVSDRLGRRAMIVTGWILFVAAWGAMVVAPKAWILVPVLAFGVFGGFAQGPQRAFVADLVPAHLRGTAYGVYNCALGIAALLGNVGFGLLWKCAGATTAFLAGTGIALAGLVVLAFVRATAPRADRSSPA